MSHPMQGNSKIMPITKIGEGIHTSEQLAEWCNNLSVHVGINRTDPKGQYYLPPAKAEDFE